MRFLSTKSFPPCSLAVYELYHIPLPRPKSSRARPPAPSSAPNNSYCPIGGDDGPMTPLHTYQHPTPYRFRSALPMATSFASSARTSTAGACVERWEESRLRRSRWRLKTPVSGGHCNSQDRWLRATSTVPPAECWRSDIPDIFPGLVGKYERMPTPAKGAQCEGSHPGGERRDSTYHICFCRPFVEVNGGGDGEQQGLPRRGEEWR